jgi:diguanylate cyclase (GGDEF)-like protein/PAS domain S-box-containing protein
MHVDDDISGSLSDPTATAATEVRRERAETPQLPLRVLAALLNADGDDDPFAVIFDSLQDVLAFDQALVLEEGETAWNCVAALPPTLAELVWRPGPFFTEIARGRVSVGSVNHALEECRDITGDLISPAQAALYLPMCVRGRRGLLILLRAAGKDFGDADLALARHFGLLAKAALAVCNAKAVDAELQELAVLADQLRQSAGETQRDSERLRGILDRLPVGLSVQGEDGRFVLVNAAAASRLGGSAVELNSRFADEHAPDECVPEEASLAGAHEPIATEEKVAGADGERTWLTTRQPMAVDEETFLVSTSIDITERKEIESDLERRAYSDDLTGLANRAMLQEHVETVLRSKDNGGRFALAFIDLDNFKHINDYYSHAVGDELLVKVARRIGDLVRPTDMLARMSGDEFVLFVDPVEGNDHIYAIIDSLLQKLKQPFHIEGFEVFTSASIGVSIYPEHGSNYEELRRNADSAMYRAKSSAKGAAAFFNQKMGQSVTARMELEQRLRLAIRDCQFCCAFQPKVDIRNQEVVGFETLIRWLDNDAEIQTPSEFIALATELGLIDPITHFVLAEAIRSMPLLDDAFGAGKSIAVNVAAKQAGDVKFMRSFIETLKASAYSDRFIVEVTEDAFIAKNQFQTQVLPKLRDIGARVSIDDFGTGYSSLSVLADITADEIKIDRSFITAIHQRPRSQSILKAIESVSYALGMSVVAEGVETFEELAYLQGATRIRFAQGYHFAKPFFLEEVASTKRGEAERAATPGREPAESRAAASPRTAKTGRE